MLIANRIVLLQITYEESLTKIKTVCFQAALLYTSSKAERRIRVHTLCIPVTESLSEVMYSADPQCIVGLLSKMAVDRSVTSSLSDARDAFINATVDIISAFRLVQNLAQTSSKLMVPENLRLLPLYILAMLKHVSGNAFLVWVSLPNGSNLIFIIALYFSLLSARGRAHG